MSSEHQAPGEGNVYHLEDKHGGAPMPRANTETGALGVKLCRELLESRAAGQRARLLVFRIRNYEQLVDTYGNEFGTAAEAALMRRLRGLLRRREPVQRIRPGEFGIVGRGIRSQQALEAMAQRMVEGGSGRYEVDGVACRLQLQVGAAACPNDSEDPEQLLQFARFALAQAAASDSQWHTFSMEDLESRRASIRMEAELEIALDEGRFVLQYQPQYHVKSGEIAAVEALVRMVTRTGERVPPDDFIPIAEDNGFIRRLGYWIMDEACQQLARWRHNGLDVPRLSLNISPKQLSDTDFLPLLDAAVSDAGIRFADLELEITERCMLEESGQISWTLDALRERGARLAIDDFGTGYSSFAYLAWQPVSVLKLDRSFLARLGQDQRIRPVIAGIIDMARQLGLELIAEGVETRKQAEFLAELGCDIAQGMSLAPPQDAVDITRLLLRTRCA